MLRRTGSTWSLPPRGHGHSRAAHDLRLRTATTEMFRRSFASSARALLSRAAVTTPPPPLLQAARAGLASASSSAKGRKLKKHEIYPQWSSPAPRHELWQENSWLGAYYKLREGDPVADRNKAKLQGKRAPTRGNFIIQTLDAQEIEGRVKEEPWRGMKWRPGCYLEVDHTPRVGESTERVVGVLLGYKRKGLGSSFRLLCHVEGTSVEYQFQTFSPLLLNVAVRKESQWRDGKRMLTQLRPEAARLPYPAPTRLERKKKVEDNDPSKYSGRKKGGS